MWVGQAFACDCRVPPWEEDFARADLLFHGRITGIQPVTDYRRIVVRFAVVTVVTVWKGEARKDLTMRSQWGGHC